MTRGETYFATVGGEIKGYGTMAPGSLHDAGQLLADVSRAFGMSAEAVLLVPVMPGSGDADEGINLAPRWAGMEASALAAGWRVTGDEGLIRDNGWATFRSMDDDRVIYMGVLSMMDQDRTPLFDLTADAETITRRLVTYASVTGVVWRMTAGVSGCAAVRHDRAARALEQLTIGVGESGEPEHQGEPVEPWWRWDTAPRELHGAGHVIWHRPLVPSERVDTARVCKYDIRAQYLAAMAGAKYGWGEPHRRASVPYDPDRAGFWQIAASGPLSLPGPPLVRHVDRGLTWVTNRVMDHLHGKGILPMVYDSYTSPTSSQWLKPWATKIRNALYAESDEIQDIEAALKRTYTETNGMFNVPGGSVFRKDVHWTTIDTAMINMRVKLEHVHQTIGMWPCEIYHDAVFYPVEDKQAFDELNLALGVKYPWDRAVIRVPIGKFRFVSSEMVPAWEARISKKESKQ